MELVSSISLSELLLFSTFGMMLGSLMTTFFQWTENPLVQTVMNTTSVVLKNTEVVWKPVLNTSLLVLRPLAEFSLAVLKPLGPPALAVAKAFVYAVMFMGQLVLNLVSTLVAFGESFGVNMTQAGKALLYGAKDLASSLLTVMRALAYVITNTLSSMSYVIDSFEMVALYIRRLLFETHLVTWQDTLDIALPFTIVACVLTFVAWRAYSKCARPSAPWKKNDDEYDIPRRSSRIARKRAMMLCSDASDTALPRKKSSTRATYL